MRRRRFARLGFGAIFGVALGTQSCSDSPGELFGPSGGKTGAAGGKTGVGGSRAGDGGKAGASNEGGTEAQPTGGDGGDGVGGSTLNGGAASTQGGRGSSGGISGISGGIGGVASGGASTGGGSSGGIGASSGGSSSHGGTAGGVASGGKAGGGNVPNEVVQQIARNNDDCTWILVDGSYQERLRFSAADPWLEVGSDTEQGRIGLRFVLPVPPKSTIISAALQLQRVAGNAPASNTLTIQVFDTGNVPSFDPSHDHGPRDHIGMAGLFSTAVRGTLVGEKGKLITSADLKVLVQRIVDRADFNANSGTIGFVISPDSVRDWVAYGDSSEEMGATLRVSYRAP